MTLIIYQDIITDNGLTADIDTVIMPYLMSSYTLPTGIENGTITDGTQTSNLTGNNANNNLIGNAGINSLDGGAGSDTLNGGLGNDKLKGGAGKDVFQLMNKSKDTINDFSVVDDTIQLNRLIFTKLTNMGVLDVNYLKIGVSASDTNDYIIYNSSNGALNYDADGSGAGAGIQIATLGLNLALTNADFVVI